VLCYTHDTQKHHLLLSTYLFSLFVCVQHVCLLGMRPCGYACILRKYTHKHEMCHVRKRYMFFVINVNVFAMHVPDVHDKGRAA
jgi:hypothetical protein